MGALVWKGIRIHYFREQEPTAEDGQQEGEGSYTYFI